MGRNFSIDLLRGFIMVWMALDHASAFIGRVHFMEMWGLPFETYPDIAWWFTRFISHLCATGFFFLMGMSMLLFAEKSRQKEWTFAQIRTYFIKRAFVILALMFFLEFPAWGLGNLFSQVANESILPGNYTGGFLLPSTVLGGLALSMLIGGFIWQLNKGLLLAITIISFTISSVYIGMANPNEGFSPFIHYLMVPGLSNGAMCIYPIIPWLGVTTFGMFWAKLLREDIVRFYPRCLKLGGAFIALFFILRFLEWGNFQLNSYHDWISFFTLIKYPPSLVFILLTLGINLILLNIFSKSFGRPWLRPILVFGQTAMFFYIAHLYLYALIGIAFPKGSSILVLYAMWGLGLVLLYFLCEWYLKFKQGKAKDSIWRML